MAYSQASLRRARTAALLLLLAGTVTGCASGASRVDFRPPTRPAQFSMVGVPWGISRDSVTATLEPRGYNYNSTDADGDMWFDGVLRGTPTRVFAYMAGDSLVKIRVRMFTPDARAMAAYDSTRTELIKLYGQPQESTKEFLAPFAKGQNEQEAVRAGKANISTHWLIGQGNRKSHVGLHMARDLVVVIDYEGPNWNREHMRRSRSRD